MRGSLLAVVAVAVVAGLGVVGAVRALGLLNPPPVAERPAPPPAAPPAVPMVAVAARHIFKGDTIDPRDLTLRAVRPGELKDFEANRAAYLGDAKEIAYFRYAARDVVADSPLRLTDLADLKKPEPLNARLAPGTRAVDLAVPKELAAGGMIAVGDWVDVYLLTDVARTDSPGRVPQAGVLVHAAPVIAKRGTLFSVFAPLAPGEPIQHTLAVNTYRAALIEYARAVGTVSLVPVSSAEKARLDDLKAKALADPKAASLAIPFAEPGSPEYKDEQDRIERYARGELAIGPADLARVLRLTPPTAPRSNTVQIELYTGVRPTGTATFRSADGGPAPPEFVFTAPTGPDGRPAPGTTVRPVAAPKKN